MLMPQVDAQRFDVFGWELEFRARVQLATMYWAAASARRAIDRRQLVLVALRDGERRVQAQQ